MDVNRNILTLIATLGVAGCDKQPISASPSAATPAPALAPVPITASPSPGRYQIFISPHVRTDTFLVDTQGGRVWTLTQFTNMVSEPTAFNEVVIIDSKGEIGMKYSEFMRLHEPVTVKDGKGKKPPSTIPFEEATGKSEAKKGVNK